MIVTSSVIHRWLFDIWMFVAIGFHSVIANLYLNEISPDNLRGALGCLSHLAGTSAVFVGQVLSLDSILGTTDLYTLLLGE